MEVDDANEQEQSNPSKMVERYTGVAIKVK